MRVGTKYYTIILYSEQLFLISELVLVHSLSTWLCSSGIFPQDEYPEEVSTDEDDEMFGSRKKKKRSQDNVERAPTAKISKGNTSCQVYGL